MIYWENALSRLLTGSMACINTNGPIWRHGLYLYCLAKGDMVHPLGAWAEHPVVPVCALGMYFLPLETKGEVRRVCEIVLSWVLL